MLKFNAKISKMGDRRIITIPKALEQMIGDYENKEITVTLKT